MSVAFTNEDGVLRPDVGAILAPRSVALVGATDRSLGGVELVRNVLAGDIPGYAVNPKRNVVAGFPAHPSIAALPEVPELAMLAVGPSRIEAVFEEAYAAGVRSFVVPGLGPDAGRDGPLVARRLAARASEAGAAFLGPNCVGFARPGRTSPCVATVPKVLPAGAVAAISQSGAVGEILLSCGPRIGFSMIVTTGAELSRDVADVLAYLAGDIETRAIGLFLESVRRPEAFVAALSRCAESEKPVVCLKVGRSSAAERTALAHTGAVVGSARVFSAVLRRYGAIEVGDMHDFIETLEVLGAQRWPRGKRVAAVSDSGGECSLLADNGEAAGIPFEPFSDRVVDKLRVDVPIPDWIRVENPLDTAFVDDRPGADFAGEIYGKTVASFRTLAHCGDFDAVVAAIDYSQFRGQYETELASAIVADIAAALEDANVFGAIVSLHASDPPEVVSSLAREHHVPMLRGGSHAMRAIEGVGTWRPKCAQVPPTGDPVALPDVAWREGALTEFESTLALERYGVAFASRVHAASPSAAADAARELGAPVVVKSHGPAHKAAVGGVVLGVESSEAAAAAAERLGGEVIVATQIPAGPEIFCGMTRDPSYGPLFAVGVGGRAVEALSLAVVALGPLDMLAAVELVEQAPGMRQLASASAQEEVARVLVAISRLADDYPDIVECEINPLIVQDERVVGVDALIVTGSPGPLARASASSAGSAAG
jgi:acetyltransferase